MKSLIESLGEIGAALLVPGFLVLVCLCGYSAVSSQQIKEDLMKLDAAVIAAETEAAKLALATPRKVEAVTARQQQRVADLQRQLNERRQRLADEFASSETLNAQDVEARAQIASQRAQCAELSAEIAELKSTVQRARRAQRGTR